MEITAEIKHHLETLIDGQGQVPPVDSLRALDGLLQVHRASLAPDLRHFLERRSYHKALAWLNGEAD